jgi:LuxR family maltose regulon positive regulatory protein
MSRAFLNEKFTPPSLPDIFAPRQQLINIFNKAAKNRLVFVSAPAGFGKTTSTLLWLADSKQKAIWIRLDTYDNVPSIFYKLLCTGIVSAQPDNTRMIKILQNPSFLSAPVENTIHLLSEFEADNQKYILIFDDIHFIIHEEILKSLPSILSRLPHSFITLQLSRGEPFQEYAELVEEGKASVITAENLAFKDDEIHKYFKSMGHFLTKSESESVFRITDGWAIGVAALAKSGQIDLDEGSGRLLDSYIKKQIWDKWDEGLQNFMLKTSVVDEIPVLLCEQLTDRDDSRELLESLRFHNTFVSRISEDVYRYHHLFLDFLRNIRETVKFKNENALYKITAEYYIKIDEPLTAIRYAVKSGDKSTIMRAARSFTDYSYGRSVDEYVSFLRNFYEDVIPERICNQYPYLYTFHAWLHLNMGNALKTEYYMDKLTANLMAVILKFPQFAEMVAAALSLDYRMPFSNLMKWFKFIPLNAPKHNTIQGPSVTLNLPYLHRSCRDFSELVDSAAMKNMKRPIAKIVKAHSAEVVLGLTSGGLMYERNSLGEALAAILDVRQKINEKNGNEFNFCMLVQLTSIYYAMNNKTLLDEIMAETEKYAKNTHCFWSNFLAYKTKLLLLDGDKDAASKWLLNYFVIDTHQLELYKIFQHFTTARAYMVLENMEKAIDYIQKLKKLAADFRRPLDIAEADVLQAVYEWAVGKRKEACITLEAVLINMQPLGFVRVIADEGAAVLPVLKKIITAANRDDYQGPLRRQYLNDVYLAAQAQSRYYSGIVQKPAAKLLKLSNQQKIIIELLAQGYKNSEIVEKTGLSINTIKTHTRLAYDKLGANNVTDAVLYAKEQGIICSPNSPAPLV